MGYSPVSSKCSFILPSHRQDNIYHGLCYTSRGSLAWTRNSSMGSPWRIDPTTHRTMSERSYHGATSRSVISEYVTRLRVFLIIRGAGRSSEVERSLMVRWVVGSILHGVDPLSYFSFQPVLHNWCNKGCGMCYPVCGMVHIKEPLLLIDKSSLCGGSGFPFSLSEWSLTICLTPYNRR